MPNIIYPNPLPKNTLTPNPSPDGRGDFFGALGIAITYGQTWMSARANTQVRPYLKMREGLQLVTYD